MQAYSRGNVVQSPYQDRPRFVILLVVVMALLGTMGLVIGLLLIMSPWLDYGNFMQVFAVLSYYLPNAGALTGAVLAVGGVAVLAVSMGLWHQEPWALWFCIIGIAVAETFLFFRFAPFSYIFIGLLILYIYLLAVRQHFRP